MKLFSFFKKRFYNNRSYNHYKNCLSTKYKNLSVYAKLYDKCISEHNLRSSKDICIEKKMNLGNTIREVKNVFGKPNSYLCVDKSLKIELLFYKLKIDNYKVKCEMHFFDNKLFFMNYTFSYLDNKHFEEIINVIQVKYNKEGILYNRQNIVDRYNNCIQVSNDLELSINYVFLDCKLFKKELFITTKPIFKKVEGTENLLCEYL